MLGSQLSTQAQNAAPPCATRTLGSNTQSTPTVIDGQGGTIYYSGTYRVIGSLEFTNGTFYLLPGTIFYVDGTYKPAPSGRPIIRGYNLFVGANATLELDDAKLMACYNMWGGVVLEPDQFNVKFKMRNGSLIRDAATAVRAPASAFGYDTFYEIENASFANNLYHIYDESRHPDAVNPCLIRNCSFSCDPNSMRYPLQSISATDRFYTYEAVHVTAHTEYNIGNNGGVRIQGNSISNASYGIVCNMQNRGKYLIQNNTLTDIFSTGIWTSRNLDPDMSSNSVTLNSSRSVYANNVSATAPAYGIFDVSGNVAGNHSDNTITGQNGTDTVNYKTQTGFLVSSSTQTRNTFSALTYGSRLLRGSTSFFDNSYSNCWYGAAITPQPFGPPLTDVDVACNTFRQTLSGLPTTHGVYLDVNASVSSLGSQGNPNGNQFDNITEPVRNDGPNSSFVYWRYNSPLENVPNIGGSNSGFAFTDFSVNPANACQNRGALAGNGVNRTAPISYATIAALMDTVRRQSAPYNRRQRYIAQIIAYHNGSGLLPGLDAYARTLVSDNPEAFRVVALYLLREYAGQYQGTPAQRLRNLLLTTAFTEAEVRNQVLLLDAEWALLHLRNQATPAPQDSMTLRRVATSGTSAAELAAHWFSYYYPTAPTSGFTKTARPNRHLTAASRTTPTDPEIYPNPASRTARVRYTLPATARTARLCLYNLLTGKQVVAFDLPKTNGTEEFVVSLADIPAGTYGYRVVADGQPGPVRQLIVR